MTQKRKQKKNKKRIMSDQSDTTSLDGSTAPYGCTARGRTHQGGSPLDDKSSRALSPPVTRNQSPVNQSLVNQAMVNQALVNQSQVILTRQSLVNQSPVNQAPVNQAPCTGHLPLTTSHQSIYHLSISVHTITGHCTSTTEVYEENQSRV